MEKDFLGNVLTLTKKVCVTLFLVTRKVAQVVWRWANEQSVKQQQNQPQNNALGVQLAQPARRDSIFLRPTSTIFTRERVSRGVGSVKPSLFVSSSNGNVFKPSKTIFNKVFS